MKYIDWSEAKNDKLKAEREICFEDALTAIDAGRLLDDIKHPNAIRYLAQRVLIVEIDGYAYLVPYVEDEIKIFLKTIVPSRKATKKYLKGDAK
ncbi:MAG TPA: BrnT family toxin [Candidatus Saccharimonadales bacterium]|nr:BrnT family toxin [Candidatus Saccharimonadales bacterium]